MLAFDTRSEQDFYDFANQHGWSAEKIERSEIEGVPTPDFKITTQIGYEFLAEITEFEPEPPLEPGEFRIRDMTLGDALRIKLREKRRQLKPYVDRYPTLIVVCGGFDHFGELDPMAFDAALYGALAVRIQVPNDPTEPPRFANEMHNAGNRFFSANANTSISAAAAFDGNPLALRIYHNVHARNPLEVASLPTDLGHVSHFTKVNGNTGWQELFKRKLG